LPFQTLHRLIYVAEGEHALGNNQTLTAEDKAALAGKTLEQVWQEIKATGGQAVSTGKSRFRGVSFHKHRAKWQVNIRVSGKLHMLGRWVNEEDAARAYDAAARLINGRWGAG
jgi:hypothetical protein